MDDQLFQACEEGSTSKFQKLLQENGSIIDQKTVGSLDSPLHLASRFNRTGLATAILELRLHMATATNAREETPLHEACRVGGLEIVRKLLVASPSVVYLLNGAKQSALFIACSHRRWEVALELCNRMTSFAWDEAGSWAALLMAASEGSTEIVQKILRENPSLESGKNERGFSALHYASVKGNLEVVQEFLGRNPNLSCLRDNDGRTPLHWAVICEKVPVVEEFLSERRRAASFNSVRIADLINIADHNGDTVLHLAARMNCLEISNLLVSKPGMKVHDANKEGKTALEISNQNFTRSQGMEATAQGDADHVPFDLIEKHLQERLTFIGIIQYLAFFGKIRQYEDEGKCKNIMPETTIPPWWFTFALGVIFHFPCLFLLARCKTFKTSNKVIRVPRFFIRLAIMLMEIAFIRFLFKIADGGDDLDLAFWFVVALVPSTGIAWTWHKLDYWLLGDTGLRLTKSD